MTLESRLRELREAGRPILAPYLTCGFPSPDVFPALVEAVVGAGADMLEIGVPFTDPLMDGPVIQRASEQALRAEMRPAAVFKTMSGLDVGVPFVLMTYVNPVCALGWDAFAAEAAAAGASGAIIPDLPPEEATDWVTAADSFALDPVFLAAPTTPPDRVRLVADTGRGFVYCVSLLGVTGVRTTLSDRARKVVERVRTATDRPALVGLGVSTPEQAADACSFADGVIVGSALLQAVFDGGVEAAADLVGRMRSALDAA